MLFPEYAVNTYFLVALDISIYVSRFLAEYNAVKATAILSILDMLGLIAAILVYKLVWKCYCQSLCFLGYLFICLFACVFVCL